MKINQLKFALAKIFMRTIGQTSEGIRLCFELGLTSGKILDYIYRHEPQGRWLIGKAIDRAFLNHPGWEAVRIRRKHLEELLIEAIEHLSGQGKAISLIDIASGPASYILSVLERVGKKDLFARCQDLDERWLKEGRAEATRRNFTNVHFEKGDAFHRRTLLSLQPRPNIVVSSGFYDWINEDGKVKESIRIVFDLLEPGGYFIVTNQTAHPNLEFVEAVFQDFDHQPLRMTMRPQEKIRQWLTAVGFMIERTLSDSKGYFSVTKARKP